MHSCCLCNPTFSRVSHARCRPGWKTKPCAVAQRGSHTETNRQALVSLASEYYAAWGQADSERLEQLVSEDHVHIDEVWQGIPRQGRDNLIASIKRFTGLYTSCRMNVLTAAPDADNQSVLVHWSFNGTFQLDHTSSTGMSILQVNKEGRISKSQVYRQATAAELEMIKARPESKLPQAGLLP